MPSNYRHNRGKETAFSIFHKIYATNNNHSLEFQSIYGSPKHQSFCEIIRKGNKMYQLKNTREMWNYAPPIQEQKHIFTLEKITKNLS